MFVVMGGTGHVGSACADALLARGETVTIVTRNAGDAGTWKDKGAQLVEADVDDVDALRCAFRRGRRAFLLNPPGDIAEDTDMAERRSVASILAALDGSGLEKVVAASTLGAQPGERIGDLSVLWELEEGLRRQPIPAAINRGAYYMSNWDALLEPARATGELPSMLPGELMLPMVAPRDLGEAAAQRLLSSIDDVGVRDVEGPARYSPAAVAEAFSRALGRHVDLKVVPRSEWIPAYRKLGFSEAAADAYARMTAVSVDGSFALSDTAIRGRISLEAYIDDLASKG